MGKATDAVAGRRGTEGGGKLRSRRHVMPVVGASTAPRTAFLLSWPAGCALVETARAAILPAGTMKNEGGMEWKK